LCPLVIYLSDSVNKKPGKKARRAWGTLLTLEVIMGPTCGQRCPRSI
jgi:hypothetical protein